MATRVEPQAGSGAPAPLRVPHLLHVFSNFVPTGPELRAVALIEAFGPAFRHSVVSMDGRTTAAERLPAAAAVRLLEGPPKAGSLATVARLRRLLERERPDLLLTYGWGAFDALLAAKSLGLAAVVHHEDGFNEDELESFKGRRVLARRLVLPGVARVVVPSERLLGVATGRWRLPAGRVRLIPNGIRPEAFVPGAGRDPELRRRLGIPETAPLVGAVGSLRPVKNLPRLLAAVAAVIALDPALGVHLLVVGDGPDRAALELRAAELGIGDRVRFAGHYADVAPWLRAMDVFALSSDTEQLPVALLEAMAAGLPVAATDVGDVRAALPPEQEGFVVPLAGAATVHGLATALEALLRDRELGRRLGRANRRRVEERYSFTRMCADYRDVYTAALTAGGRP